MNNKIISGFKGMLSVFLVMISLNSCQENISEESLLTWDSETTSYRTDIGGEVFISAEIVATDGLDIIIADIPAWSAGGSPERETIEITGSPKKYTFNYEVSLPEDAEAGDHKLVFTLKDYAGKEYMQSIDVFVASDDIQPELEIISPENEIEVFPDGTVVFDVRATDNLKMKEVVILCEKLGFNRTFVPEENDKSVYANCEVDLNNCAPGNYEFVIKAVDAQLNETVITRTIKAVWSSKPRIHYEQSVPVCGVSGGSLPFKFKIETNEKHPLKTVKILCPALSIDESVQPETGTWSFAMNHIISLPQETPGQRNLEFNVIATNDIDESTEYKGTLHIFDKIYLIGRGTLAFEKQGSAIPMQQETENPDVFSAVTWINKVGLGVKFLAAPSWDDFNWGLDASGENIVSPESNFITTEKTGYYKCRFNPVTWEYSLTELTVSDAPETDELYLNGNAFWYKNESGDWVEQGDWSAVLPFKKHPANPHCFYIDVKTGPEGSNVALWKIFGQPTYEGTGLFYAINADASDAGQWMYHWWEYCGPYYKYSTFDETAYFREDGRKDEVMRLCVDTWLGYMSWMPLTEYEAAGLSDFQ